MLLLATIAPRVVVQRCLPNTSCYFDLKPRNTTLALVSWTAQSAVLDSINMFNHHRQCFCLGRRSRRGLEEVEDEQEALLRDPELMVGCRNQPHGFAGFHTQDQSSDV
jgi:hypothetical protein